MGSRRVFVRVAIFGAVGMLLAASPTGIVASASRGSTIKVNSTSDQIQTDGQCTLREAIRSANLDRAIGGCAAGHGTDTIVLPAGHFVLKIYGTAENGGLSGDLDIWTAMTIRGSRGLPTIVDGGGVDRVFEVVGEAHVTIDHLTIEGGSTTDAAGTDDDHGAGITTRGTLTLTNSVVDGNSTGPEGAGGGIYNTGTLTVSDSIISNNHSGSGGGIYSSRSAAIRYDLIDGNSADGRDGVRGPDAAGGISSHGWLDVYQSVVTNNSGGPEWGNGGIAMDGGVVSLTAIESNGSGECGTGGIVMNNTVLSRSTVAYNSAGYCGVAGVYAINSQVVNTTISNNVIPYAWGGESVGGIRSEGSSLLNVTIAYNKTAEGPGGLDPEFVSGSLNPTVLTNSIIADNSGQQPYPSTAAWPDCGGIVVNGHASVVSGGNNLIRDLTTCVLAPEPTDHVGVNPLLEPLANYGGPKAGPRSEIGTPLLTHTMRPGSPAIDAIGAGAACPALDERGVHRPQDGNGDRVKRCDIGALEWMR
jgi:CSLREA domain-containing protein